VTDSERLHKFLELSSKLTAFSVYDLQGTGQAEPYLSTVTDVVGPEIVDKLLGTYARVKTGVQIEGFDVDGMLRREILADELLGPIARNIIKMWYVGIWYQLPAHWSQTFAHGFGRGVHRGSALDHDRRKPQWREGARLRFMGSAAANPSRWWHPLKRRFPGDTSVGTYEWGVSTPAGASSDERG
jgi:hypothetical protein